MSCFKAKMHQVRFRLKLRPRPRWGTHSAPQTYWLDLRGGEKGREGKEKERGEGKGPICKARREGGEEE